MNSFKVLKLENAKDLPTPKRATKLSAGMDLYANIIEDVEIKSGEISIISAGIKVIVPSLHEIQIRPRSGLAAKFGITVLNSPGTIDEDYRGEIKIILINHSNESFIVHRGDRIAQMVLCPISYLIPDEIDEEQFNKYETDRNQDGFGSTGIK